MTLFYLLLCLFLFHVSSNYRRIITRFWHAPNLPGCAESANLPCLLDMPAVVPTSLVEKGIAEACDPPDYEVPFGIWSFTRSGASASRQILGQALI